MFVSNLDGSPAEPSLGENHPSQQTLFQGDLVMNVFRDGRWGSFRHQIIPHGTVCHGGVMGETKSPPVIVIKGSLKGLNTHIFPQNVAAVAWNKTNLSRSGLVLLQEHFESHC